MDFVSNQSEIILDLSDFLQQDFQDTSSNWYYYHPPSKCLIN